MPNQPGINDHNGANADKLAARYRQLDRRAIYPDIFKHFTEAAQKGQTLNVLDLGCGSGNDAYEIAQSGHIVVGVEPSDLRQIAERDFAHANITYLDDQLPALKKLDKNKKFDAVLMSAVIQYIDPAERVASLITIASLLKPGGKIFLTYPSPPSRDHQFEVNPAMLDNDIKIANKSLSPEQRLSNIQSPIARPDKTGRKSLDGRPMVFYSQTLSNQPL